MAFRDRLVATIRAARAVLEAEGVLVVGSEVPNLLEPGAAATLIVSQHLDIGVPVDRHAQVKPRLSGLRAFAPSADEPCGPFQPDDPLVARAQGRDAGPAPAASRRGGLAPPPRSGRRGSLMSPSFERRLRQLRSRVLVRSWEYRQRRHARGVWFRLRRVLAEASEAYAVTLEQAHELVREGHTLAPVGQELDPPKLIVFAPAARVARLASARPLAVRLSVDLMRAQGLALVPFETEAKAGL